MSAKHVDSDRRRSRPVEKVSVKKKMKRNKPAMFLAIFIIVMLLLSGLWVIFSSLNSDEDKDNSTFEEDNPIAVFDTSMGEFKVELYLDKVPITAGNFIDLANEEYYDGVIFHRVIEDFMIQGGDPLGTGYGGHAAEYHEGYGDPDNPDTWVIPDEFDSDLSNVRGTISMANSGPNTGGSQFFINVVSNTHLDYNKDPSTSKHAVFGKVTEGMDVVDSISEVSTDPTNNKPYTDVVINSITILEE